MYFPNSKDYEEDSLKVNYSITVFLDYKRSCHRDVNFYKKELMSIKKQKTALAGVAHWIEHWPANQRVTGTNPSQGTWLG